jgi:hypothetical protein
LVSAETKPRTGKPANWEPFRDCREIYVMARDYDLTIGMFTKDFKFDAESLATLKRSFVDLKLLATPPDMSTLYTEAFLPKGS